MPDEYIKRSDALLEIQSIPKGNWSSKRFVGAIEAVPAADVEPVVHCRECKYRNQRIPVHNAICTKCYEMDCEQGYGFCSMGEKMEEEDG